MRERLILKVSEILKINGFETVECIGIHSAFDIIAKKDIAFLIKILSNIEALTLKISNELKKLAYITSGFPIVVGYCMKGKKLMDRTIYFRYNIPVVNLETFTDIISGESPNVYAVHGNYCVKINPEALAEMRKKLNMTQEELAEELGISKQSIYRYECYGNVSFHIAEKIRKLFGADFLEYLNLRYEEIFDFKKICYTEKKIDLVHEKIPKLERLVISELQNLGFKISITNAPFDLVALEIPENERVFAIVSNDLIGLKKRAEIIKKISSMLNAYKVCISERKHEIDILVIKPKDLSEISRAKDLIQLLKEEG